MLHSSIQTNGSHGLRQRSKNWINMIFFHLHREHISSNVIYPLVASYPPLHQPHPPHKKKKKSLYNGIAQLVKTVKWKLANMLKCSARTVVSNSISKSKTWGHMAVCKWYHTQHPYIAVFLSLMFRVIKWKLSLLPY